MVYALGTMGYHFGDSIIQALIRERQSDFYEMLLHHIATCSLYFCMIYGNNMGIGCLIAYLHDIADIFGALVKCASTTKYANLTVLIFLIMMCLWFWTRLFVLPQIIYRIMTDEFVPSVQLFVKLNGIFLCVLQFLHIYWFYMFLAMLLHKLKTGEAEDLQNRHVA